MPILYRVHDLHNNFTVGIVILTVLINMLAEGEKLLCVEGT